MSKEGSLLLPLPPLPNLHAHEPKPKPPPRIPRILFNGGMFTIDGPMVSIFLSLCLISSSFGGLFVIPWAKYGFCFIILIEIAVILSVLAKSKCCISLSIIYKAISLVGILICGFPMGYALISVEKPTKKIAEFLNNVEPADLAPVMNIAVWVVCVFFIFATLFSYLHFASLIETVQRVEDISAMREERRAHPLPPPPRVITHFPIITNSPPSSVSQFEEDGDRISILSNSV